MASRPERKPESPRVEPVPAAAVLQKGRQGRSKAAPARSSRPARVTPRAPHPSVRRKNASTPPRRIPPEASLRREKSGATASLASSPAAAPPSVGDGRKRGPARPAWVQDFVENSVAEKTSRGEYHVFVFARTRPRSQAARTDRTYAQTTDPPPARKGAGGGESFALRGVADRSKDDFLLRRGRRPPASLFLRFSVFITLIP